MKAYQFKPSIVILSLAFLVGFGILQTHAQFSITGPTSVNPSDVDTYYLNPSGNVMHASWSVVKGTLSGSSMTQRTVTWGLQTGLGQVSASGMDIFFNPFGVNLNVTINSPAPGIPNSPSITNNCGNTVMTTSPPSGETYYWQTSSTGTSQTDSQSPKTFTQGTVTYLRSYNGQWGPALTVNYTVNQPNTWYADGDGDGFGDPNDTQSACSQPSGYVSSAGDNCPEEAGTVNGCHHLTGTLSNDKNYVYSVQPRIAMTSLSNTNRDNYIESINYFDGLGRPMQSTGIGAGGAKEDVITHISYNDVGLQDKEYLPYADTSTNLGAFNATAEADTDTYYGNEFSTDYFYSEKDFEESPLNRVLKQAAPGDSWKMGSGHEIEFEYDANTATEVRRYTVDITSTTNNTFTPSLVLNTSLNNGYYVANQLTKTITRDENHSSGNKHTTEEFKDKNGRVILKRTYAASDTNRDGDTNDTGESEVAHDTYYVYDDFGNLTYVLPPLSDADNGKPSSTALNELCYQYVYDHRNRLVEKKIPGKEWEYIIYDKLDRPVMTQDALQRANNEWLYTKYDELGRVAYTGIHTNTTYTTRTGMQTYFDGENNSDPELYEGKVSSGTGHAGSYYSNDNFPKLSVELLTVNYYDNYDFDLAGSSLPGSISSYGITPTTDVHGLATGSKVKVLGASNWITTISYYDDKARVIYTYSHNEYLNTTDTVKSKLDFTGRVDETTSTHTNANNTEPTLDIVDVFTYDHMGRLEIHDQTIENGDTERIVFNSYDELGQLESKGVGNLNTASRLQTVDYTYNIRGWLTQINNVSSLGTDLFGFKINYNTQNHGATTLFNGNIAETEWKTANDNTLRWYTYDYDALNRLISANDHTTGNDYKLDTVVYDPNGNITYLKRQGHTNTGATLFGTMDELTYSYTGNQLDYVTDSSLKTTGFNDGNTSGNDYDYDANGNMTQDLNKGIGANKITYNHLNLPTKVDFGGGDKIEYFYDASGIKLEKKVTEGSSVTSTLYAGGYIYNKPNGGTEALEFFNHPEGYIDASGTGYDYVYQYKDHLGNIRLSYKNTGSTSSPTLEIQEENNYYPFGLKHKGYNGNVVSEHGYTRFNGQEYEESLGLNMQEMMFRQYDPALGRFNVVDRLAELAPNYTPYRFGYNNPVFYTDPLGLFETRREARQYRRENNIKGGRIKKQDDGSYAIIGKGGYHFQAGDDSGLDHDFLPNDGVVMSILVKGDSKRKKESQNYSRRMSPLPGAVPSYDKLKEHHGMADAVSLTLEFASPVSFGDLYGFGITVGVTETDDGKKKDQRGFITYKATYEPGLALGVSLDYTSYTNLTTDPLSAQRLDGLGAESGGSLFIGGSMGSDAVYRTDINGFSVIKDPTYNTRTLSLGIGIEGYVNWITNTQVSDD